jgi:subtilisin family serine protease
MRYARLGSLALIGMIGLAACEQDGRVPVTGMEPTSPALRTAASDEHRTTGNLLVVFAGESVPDGFEARVSGLGGAVDASFASLGAATVSGLGEPEAEQLRAFPGVSYVEPELLLDLPTPLYEPEPAEVEAGPESPSQPSSASFFPRQWHLQVIEADRAWAAGHLGSSDVTVAILDTGIGYTHRDLVGLVDLDRSKSFLPKEDAAVQQYFPGAHPIADLYYHGTHVAATVASNGWAAAGVTSRTTLIGLKVCGTVVRGCPASAIFAALQYAADNGADVVNMSLGGSFTKSRYPGYVSTINRAFTYLDRKSVTVVVSAGNSALDLDRDGAGYKTYCDTPTNFCVSATGPTAATTVNGPWANIDAPAYYTNYGRSAINVAAPGGNSGASVWAACSPFSVLIPVCQTGTYVVGIRGTSMAAPHASGVAALMVEKHGKNPGAVRTAIEQASDDLGQAGLDPFYGRGRINVARALGM